MLTRVGSASSRTQYRWLTGEHCCRRYGILPTITSLPKKESDLPEWQTAIEALMLCSRGGDPMLARIGVMKALNRHVERVFSRRPFVPDNLAAGQCDQKCCSPLRFRAGIIGS